MLSLTCSAGVLSAMALSAPDARSVGACTGTCEGRFARYSQVKKGMERGGPGKIVVDILA